MDSRVNILNTIVAKKREEVARLPDRPVDEAILRTAATRCEPRRDFFAALDRPRLGRVGLIAEIKKASPSAGLIRPDFDPVAIARDYEAGGASCLSVLTDEPFFQGRLDYLTRVRSAVSLPLLRKDFIIDARQILEALEAGADAILLIAAILDDAQLETFARLAAAANMSSLVEVHDLPELERVMAMGAPLIGVNNRDLKSFAVDLRTTERLARRLRETATEGAAASLLVAESGIHSREDVRQLEAWGARAVLVGESLMRHHDLPAKTRSLLEDSAG